MIFAQAPDYSYHLPWFLKLSLIVLGIRAFVWVLKKLPKENKSLRKPARNSAAAPPVPRSAAPVSPERIIAQEILVLRDGQQLGPYTVDEINRQLSAHALDSSDLAWHEGLAEWQSLSLIAGVITGRAHHLHPPPPPVRTTN